MVKGVFCALILLRAVVENTTDFLSGSNVVYLNNSNGYTTFVVLTLMRTHQVSSDAIRMSGKVD